MNTTLLRKLSIGYLLLPNFLFFFYWFKIQYSVPIIIGLGYLFWLELKKKNEPTDFQISSKEIIGIIVVCTVWTFLSGVGNLSFQTIDHIAHNGKYNDLSLNTWPLYYPEQGQYACYFFGYYLVPALVSKWVGEPSAVALFIWNTIGFALGLAWVYLLLNRKVLYIVLFLCLGGIGHFLKTLIYRFVLHHDFHVVPFLTELWSVFEQSLWVPNQVIPSMIVSCILLFDAFFRNRFEETFFPITIIFTWAIFPAIVFVLVFGIIAIKAYSSDFQRLFSKEFVIHYFLPGCFFLPTFLYLLSSSGGSISSFIWTFEPITELILEYSIEIVLDLAILLLLTYSLRHYFHQIPLWFAYATYTLFFLISQYRIGITNDWFIRGIIPIFCLIGIFLLRALQAYFNTKPRPFFPQIIALSLLISTFVPASHLVRALRANVITHQFFPSQGGLQITPYNKYPNIIEALTAQWSTKAAMQYLGAKGSFYEIYLARTSPSKKEP